MTELAIQFLKCKRCGRALSTPESREIGYGPVCFKKVHEDENIQCNLFNFEVRK